jgi:hypothetical protein
MTADAPLGTLQTLFNSASRHSVALEVSGQAILYLPLIWISSRHLKSPRLARILKLPYVPLLIHLISSFFELVLYYGYLATQNASPTPKLTDFVLAIAQITSSIILTAHVRRGNAAIVHATFHCMAFERLIASTLAYYHGSSMWHRVSIKLLNNFTYARWLGLVLPFLAGLRGFKEKYTTVIFFAQLIALWESGFPLGIPVFCAMMGLLLAVNKWAGGKLEKEYVNLAESMRDER